MCHRIMFGFSATPIHLQEGVRVRIVPNIIVVSDKAQNFHLHNLLLLNRIFKDYRLYIQKDDVLYNRSKNTYKFSRHPYLHPL